MTPPFDTFIAQLRPQHKTAAGSGPPGRQGVVAAGQAGQGDKGTGLERESERLTVAEEIRLSECALDFERLDFF